MQKQTQSYATQPQSAGNLQIFEQQRTKMLNLAYRMLGSYTDAEDVVQDAYFRWRQINVTRLHNPAAYLMKTVTHLCIDGLRQRKVEKLNYPGHWLPEPMIFDTDPAESHENIESLGFGLLFLLERLMPLERAVFTLREAFDLDHLEIAGLLQISSANSRQLLRRAKARLDLKNQPNPINLSESKQLLERFYSAMETGEFGYLGKSLVEEVEAISDGGGKASAALIRLKGITRVTTVLGSVLSKQKNSYRWESGIVNGESALLAWEGNTLSSVTLLYGKDQQVARILIIRNPEKLRGLQRMLARPLN